MSTDKTLIFDAAGSNLMISSMQNWRIVISDDATASGRYAAEEFQKWFNQAASLALPLGTAEENTNHNDGQVNISASSAMDDEEIRIAVGNNKIQVSGGLPRGVLYAVHQFLEELVGIRFLTADHTYIPDVSELKIPCGSYTYNPPFSFRWSYYQLLPGELKCPRICCETQS